MNNGEENNSAEKADDKVFQGDTGMESFFQIVMKYAPTEVVQAETNNGGRLKIAVGKEGDGSKRNQGQADNQKEEMRKMNEILTDHITR